MVITKYEEIIEILRILWLKKQILTKNTWKLKMQYQLQMMAREKNLKI